MNEYGVAAYIQEARSTADPISRAAQFVKDQTSANDAVQALTTDYGFMRFYVQAKRLPATKHVFSDFRQIWTTHDMVDDLERQRPKVIVAPSLDLGGMDMSSPALAGLLARYYRLERTFGWSDPSSFYRFLNGKAIDPGSQYVEVYVRKDIALAGAAVTWQTCSHIYSVD